MIHKCNAEVKIIVNFTNQKKKSNKMKKNKIVRLFRKYRKFERKRSVEKELKKSKVFA